MPAQPACRQMSAQLEVHVRVPSALASSQGGPTQQQQGGGWQAAATDGGHLSLPQEGDEQQPGSPGLRQAGETKGVRCAEGVAAH